MGRPSEEASSARGSDKSSIASIKNIKDEKDDKDHHHHHHHQDTDSASELDDDHDDKTAPSAPILKRRRVTRACDECRRKKIKCDGKQPCTHCTVYSYECTYDQPSNRRRNAPPQYVESLEQQLKRANTIIQALIPGLDLADPDLEAKLQRMQLPPQALQILNASTSSPAPPPYPEDGKDSQLESMVKATGDLDLDEQGNFEYHGHSSGLHFMRRMRESLGAVMGPEPGGSPFAKARSLSVMVDSPRSASDSPYDATHGPDLPPRALARELCDVAINDAGALLRIVHYPTFLRSMDRLYDVPPDQYGNDENIFLPLFYSVLAVAALFAKPGPDGVEQGYEVAINEGFKYFKQSRQLMDIADCRDLRQLQALVFMVIFLQSSAKLSVCYAYIGVALRSALRMGLHRSFTKNFNSIEAETRKRTFWVIRKLDTYVGALLGLPHSLDDDEIDQELPTEVDDEYITETAILPMPKGKISLMTAANAHTRLVEILGKIVKRIYPPRASTRRTMGKNTYSVSYASIVEIEKDLQSWQDSLPLEMKPGGDATLTMQRCQHMLRMAYAHAQMMLYRPFLHYVSQARKVTEVDKRSYACAAASVSVARNIVHIAIEMKKRGLLQGAYWFTMYTTFFAILSLVFYAFENPNSESSQEVLKSATEAKEALDALAKRSLAADRCATTLKTLFEQLPQHPIVRKASVSKKRRQAGSPAPDKLRIGTTKQTDSTHHSKPQAIQPNTQSYPTGMQYAAANGFYDESNMGSTPESLSISFSPTQATFTDSPGYGDNLPLADLSAMMFPNPDPLAYPTQPNGTNVDYQALFGDISSDGAIVDSFPGGIDMRGSQSSASGNIDGSSNFVPPSTFMYQQSGNTNGVSADGDVPLLGPMPMYMMQGDSVATQQVQTPTRALFGFPNTSPLSSTVNFNAQAEQNYRAQQPSQQQNQAFSQPNPRHIQLDALLGNEEWKGLPLDRVPGTGAYINPQMRNGVNSGKPSMIPQSTSGSDTQAPFGQFAADMLGWQTRGY